MASNTESNTTIYCVNCGVSFDFEYSGHVIFDLEKGLQKATISFHGSMHSNLQFAIESHKKWESKSSNEIVDVTLGGIMIPGVVTFGPHLGVDSEIVFAVEAEGKLTARLALDWKPNTEIDLLAWQASSSGWTPTMTPLIQIEGGVSVGISVALPISLGFELNILSGVFKKQLAIVEKPELAATVTVAAHFDMDGNGTDIAVNGGLGSKSGFVCDTVAVVLDFKNSVYIDVLGAVKIPLGDVTVPVWQHCMRYGSPRS